MFYAKLPNYIYVYKNNKNDHKGTKPMKDKSSVTEMIATATDGYRLPIAIIGKPKIRFAFSYSGVMKRHLFPTKSRRIIGLTKI